MCSSDLAERVEGNLLAAKQEIDKLALLHPAGHELGIAETEAAVADVARFDVFQLAAAGSRGRSCPPPRGSPPGPRDGRS